MLLPEEAAGGAADTAEPNGLPDNDTNGEGTTPEEVSQVLKSAGMNLPDAPQAQIDDDEEGDDPDKVVADDTPKPDEDTKEEPEADDEQEEEVKDPPKPDVKPEEQSTEDKYAFTVEDANGVTYKITADADIEDVLKEFEPKNNGQIISILDQLRQVKEAKSLDDAKAAEDSVKAERTEAANKLLEGWGAEAKDLQAQKRIPDGADGDKRVEQVYKFMADENEKRMSAGKPTLNSFEDALDKLENKEARTKAVEDAKSDKANARKNGALVGGSSAAATSGSPTYVRGMARNANEAIQKMGLLRS
jgi:hypothetical protein